MHVEEPADGYRPLLAREKELAAWDERTQQGKAIFFVSFLHGSSPVS